MPPGWYPDQMNPTLVRFWDGRQWTARTAPAFPPAPGPQPAAGAEGRRGRWQALRLRTKVLLVVGALVVFGALMPDEDQAPAASDNRDVVQAENPTTADEEAVEDAEVAAAADEEAAEDEAVEEEAVEEEAVEEEPIAVPLLRAQTIEQARTALRDIGLKSKIVRRPSWQPVGEVLKQGTKAGAVMAAGAIVTLVVAAPMPKVPGVFGQGAAAAQDVLRRAGFKVRVVQKVVSSGADDVVLAQTPAGTTSAAPGSVVELVVSNVVAAVAPPVSNCTPGYKPCLAPASDYDCAGGSGDGPQYAYGPISVTGSDPYDLDSEGDGIACE